MIIVSVYQYYIWKTPRTIPGTNAYSFCYYPDLSMCNAYGLNVNTNPTISLCDPCEESEPQEAE
jgi:hypothetical protein